jgi:hypothetical protein
MSEDNSILKGMIATLPEGYRFLSHTINETDRIYCITFRTDNARVVNVMSRISLIDLQSKLMPRVRLERKAETIARAVRREGASRHLEFSETVDMVLMVIMVSEMSNEYNFIKSQMAAE